jgi:trigger factor
VFQVFEDQSSMQVLETLSEGLKRGFTVVVPEPELAAKREKRLLELGRSMQMPGFRPGKVPMSIVRKRYGDAVAAEVVEGAVNDASDRVLTERGLRPAMTPKLEVTRPGRDSDLEFTMEMELLPEITLPGLADIALQRPVATVTDEAIDASLKKLQEQRQTFEPVEEPRPAAKGERLTVDFVGRIDGEPFQGGTANDVGITVAGSGFIPGFAEQTEGMSPGETKTIEVQFPADYGAKELAGKQAAFEIVAKSLSVPVLPVLDDAFGKELGLDSLDELRTKISEQIGREYEQMSRLKLKRALLDALAERAQFTPPSSLVEAEFTEIWRQVEQEKAAGRVDPEDAAKDEATLKEEYQAIADRRVRLGLLVAEIGRSNNIVVSDQDLQRAMFNEAMKYRDQAMQVVEFFKKNPNALERFRGPIFEDKVVDYLLANVTLEDIAVTPEELAADPES